MSEATPEPAVTPEPVTPGPAPIETETATAAPAVATLIDATHEHAGNIPSGTLKVGAYVTGTADIVWTAADYARFAHAGILRYDQSPALEQYGTGAANIADVEPGAGTISNFVTQTVRRIAKGMEGNEYGDRATITDTAAVLKAHGVDLGKVRCVLADWNLSETEAAALLGTDIGGIEVTGVQWASPTSNPATVVPGGTQTLAEAQVDLNVTMASWFAPHETAPPPPPPPSAVKGVVVDAELNMFTVTSTDKKTWTVN